MRYIDHFGQITTQYPYNPNGSPEGITALSNTDGRVLIMMPHPERVFRAVQLSFDPARGKSNWGPWMKLFSNARQWLD